jgi:hypothetical protein
VPILGMFVGILVGLAFASAGKGVKKSAGYAAVFGAVIFAIDYDSIQISRAAIPAEIGLQVLIGALSGGVWCFLWGLAGAAIGRKTAKRGEVGRSLKGRSYASPGFSSNAGRPVVDLRSSEERQTELTAGAALRGKDEDIARRLVELLQQIKAQQWTRSAMEGEDAYQAIRAIGQQLNSDGGMSRMQRVGYRVKALGGKARLLEISWDGIGGWME